MEICEDKSCTGCGACAEVCPKQCISMKPDEEGFLKPMVNEQLCVQCKKCIRICPSNQTYAERNIDWTTKAYSYIHPDQIILGHSTSGGAFSALAEWIINKGGCVFGAAYDENFNVKLKMAETMPELEVMRGSKYVECNTSDSYKKAKKALEDKRYVLYTGSPCHVAGLYATLGNMDCSKLYTIELLCHGVPSTKLFHSYIDYLQKKYGKIIYYSFRDKKKWGWGCWGCFRYKKDADIKTKNFVVASDYYYSLFFKENCFRESCYSCKYASLPRLADITIGDYWGIEKERPYSEIKNGVSLVLSNNQHGEELLQTLGNRLETADLESVKNLNLTIIHGTYRQESRTDFYKNFAQYGFLDTAKKYVKIRRCIPILARYMPSNLKDIIKKMVKH